MMPKRRYLKNQIIRTEIFVDRVGINGRSFTVAASLEKDLREVVTSRRCEDPYSYLTPLISND
jgi:hypothetical protein